MMRIITPASVLVLCVPAASAWAAGNMPIPGVAAPVRSGVASGASAGNSTLNAEQLAQSDSLAHGKISLEARQLQGAEAIDVEGSAPPNLPVTITLLATVSSDVPTILVSRHDVITDVTGRFGAVIPIASAYERGTLLDVLATSATGVASASAHLVTGAPNDGVSVPLEQQPY